MYTRVPPEHMGIYPGISRVYGYLPGYFQSIYPAKHTLAVVQSSVQFFQLPWYKTALAVTVTAGATAVTYTGI